MFAYLHGVIKYIGQESRRGALVIVDVNGVGYEVTILAKELKKQALGKESEFYIFHHIWQDGQELFGFSTMEELGFFKLLLSAPGVGPKTALGVLEKSSLKDIQEAVLSGNAEYLARASGIGPKTAAKIVLGLKGSIQGVLTIARGQGEGSNDIDVIDALISLGFSPEQARRAASDLPPEIQESKDRVKEALKILGKNTRL